jgi:hypothetical protein
MVATTPNQVFHAICEVLILRWCFSRLVIARNYWIRVDCGTLLIVLGRRGHLREVVSQVGLLSYA